MLSGVPRGVCRSGGAGVEQRRSVSIEVWKGWAWFLGEVESESEPGPMVFRLKI